MTVSPDTHSVFQSDGRATECDMTRSLSMKRMSCYTRGLGVCNVGVCNVDVCNMNCIWLGLYLVDTFAKMYNCEFVETSVNVDLLFSISAGYLL